MHNDFETYRDVLNPVRWQYLFVAAFVCGMNILIEKPCSADDNRSWKQLASIPDPLGVAGPACGTDGRSLIVAGGANFPDEPPWNNGRKVWLDKVYVLEEPSGNWISAGTLTRPIGYAVSVSIPSDFGVESGVACLGGSNADGHYADCWLLRWKAGKLEQQCLPPLPKTCANACGALMGETIYVAGGIEWPDSTNALHSFWSLNLRQQPLHWRELPAWPGPGRMLAIAAVQDHAFFLCSGVSLTRGADGRPVRTYLRDAYRYSPDEGWTRIADMPRAAVAAASPAPSLDPNSFMVLGGDDGSLVDFRPLAQHPGFPRTILAYQSKNDRWNVLSSRLPVSHVTTSAVLWRGSYIIPTGEIRPGVRSPEVWSLADKNRP